MTGDDSVTRPPASLLAGAAKTAPAQNPKTTGQSEPWKCVSRHPGDIQPRFHSSTRQNSKNTRTTEGRSRFLRNQGAGTPTHESGPAQSCAGIKRKLRNTENVARTKPPTLRPSPCEVRDQSADQSFASDMTTLLRNNAVSGENKLFEYRPWGKDSVFGKSASLKTNLKGGWVRVAGGKWYQLTNITVWQPGKMAKFTCVFETGGDEVELELANLPAHFG